MEAPFPKGSVGNRGVGNLPLTGLVGPLPASNQLQPTYYMPRILGTGDHTGHLIYWLLLGGYLGGGR